MTSFRLDQHPRRGLQPLSTPPAGYFEQLPTRVMAQVAAPARPWPLLAAWLSHAPAYVRTSLASTLLLGTFAASLWLGGGAMRPTPTAGLNGVPREELLDYLASDARLDMTDLAELPAHSLGLTTHYLRPSAPELADALDAQPTDEAALL